MISIKKLRENPKRFEKKLKSKDDILNIKSIIEIDKKVRRLKHESNLIRSKRNVATEQIGELKRKKEDAASAMKKARELGVKLKLIESDLSKIELDLNRKLLNLPNLPHSSVPKGENEKSNKIVREWGEKPKFDFKPKNHIELGENNQLFDFKTASKISGSGFSLYIGKGAMLERHLINSMLDYHIKKFNFTEFFPPVLMSKKSMLTTGQLPKFEDDMYYCDNDELYLAPTAEVPITNIHRNDTLNEKDLPLQYVGYSPCFRREAGSYGKDTRGLLRLHQFNKVEMVKFVAPENSYEELEILTTQAESILQKLGLTYRVVELCRGDLSFAASKCYDLEIWAPGEEKWLEVSSCSNFESFQSRRGNIRFRRLDDQKIDFVHTLNGSGLATPRLIVSLIETYQTESGMIKFPKDVSEFLGTNEVF
tara:strand:+ start:467 stop:1735 length:1269 start_codon:yes stop_codon:yes gene_type:complete